MPDEEDRKEDNQFGDKGHSNIQGGTSLGAFRQPDDPEASQAMGKPAPDGPQADVVHAGELDESAPEIDPDLPETLDEDDEPPEEHDPLDVVLPLNHAKELVDNLMARGYVALAEAFLAAENGETITIHVEV